MSFLDLVKKRYSVREFISKTVEKEKINYIVESVRFAPSAVNKQPWKLFYVTEQRFLFSKKKKKCLIIKSDPEMECLII